MFTREGRVAEHLLGHAPANIAIPAIVFYELESGVARSHAAARRREQLRELVSTVRLLPFGSDEAVASARLREDLEKRGCPIGPLDTLIAGTAMAAGATLVTHNTKEFGRVTGLRVVDWF